MKSDATQEDGSTDSGPVTISAPPAAAVTIDPQNPLPEPSFKYRRILAFLVTFTLLGLQWFLAVKLHALGDSTNLLTFAKWSIFLNGLVLTYYFVAPSAAELVSMIQSARIIKSSMVMADNASKDRTDSQISTDNRAESKQAARFAGAPSPDSQISEEALRGPENGSSGDLPESEEEDAAPRGRP